MAVKTEEATRTMREIIDAEPKVTVRFPMQMFQEDETGEQVVPVQVNGIHMQVQCGVPVDMPVSMYLALRRTGRYDI